jgi:hypothetical protein
MVVVGASVFVVVVEVEVVGVVVAFTVVAVGFTVVVVAAVAAFTFPRNVRVGRTPFFVVNSYCSNSALERFNASPKKPLFVGKR